ncbi:MAG: efflux RND transporter permease subunit [Acidobacteriota bacterium]
MTISEYAVRRPVTVLMATLCVIVLGAISLTRLPLTLLPEFSSNNLVVFASYPSSSPEEVERNITRPLEEYLSTLEGLETIESTSSNSGAFVRLEFRDGVDMDMAALDVRDRIDQVRNLLPEDVERVTIRRWQTTDMPVMMFAVSWEGSRDDLYRIVEDVVRPRLERVEGVANVDVRGLDAKQVIVELDEDRLRAHSIDVFALGQALRANNVNLSGGYILEGDKKYTLRTVGEFRTADEIAQLPLLRGRLTLGDVATIRYDFPPREDFSRLNGHEAVRLLVYKASTANVVAVCESIKEELERIRQLPSLQGKIGIQIYRDQADPILTALRDLRDAGLFGGLLAAVVLFLFLLKVRSTLIISLAIPTSVIFTCAFMYLMRVLGGSDISLNIVSLMGLMVAVGMLVDNSVVVLENIFRYKQDKGYGPLEAAIKGSREVGLAVVASTATTIVVFASFIFMPSSVSGRWTRDFGITITTALAASLLVAVTVIPTVAARVFTGPEKPKQRVIRWMTDFYGKCMGWMMRWRFVVFIFLAGLGYASYVLFSSVEREFMPPVAEREIEYEVMAERTLSPDDMVRLFQQIEQILLERKDELEIASISSDFSTRSTRRGYYRGELEIFLTQEGTTPVAELREKILALLPKPAGVQYRPGRMRGFGGSGDMGINVELRGDDPALLSLYADEVKRRLENLPGVSNVQSSLETGDDEIHLSVDRHRLEQVGLSSMAVARTITSALSTRATTRLKGDSSEIDVILQLRNANDVRLEELLNIALENREGEFIPLHTLVSYEYRKGPLSIRRDNRKATVTVVAESKSGSTFFLSQAAQRALADLTLPPGYSWEFGRSWRQAREGEQESFNAIILAIVFMYIIMAALFEDFLHPLTILFTVPFSVIGVALMFYFTHTPLSQMAYLGILVLFGIVVNNGIILVDHINTLRRSGMERAEAIVQAGMDRLRPILMTAATSIFGLLPLALPYLLPQYFQAASGRSAMWAPVSLAVLGGLTTSTLLTLLILPAVYTYMDDLSRVVTWVMVRVASPVRTLRAVFSRSS